MSDAAPFLLSYNLTRLGQAGDEIAFFPNESERAALARLAQVLEIPKFDARVLLKKLSPTRFLLSYELAAEVMQACVVTLEPLLARITREFDRELHLSSPGRHAHPGPDKEIALGPEDEDAPEEISSPHYDLAAPLIEEFLLAIDPYPRAPGGEFVPPDTGEAKPANPFAALKGLKSGP